MIELKDWNIGQMTLGMTLAFTMYNTLTIRFNNALEFGQTVHQNLLILMNQYPLPPFLFSLIVAHSTVPLMDDPA